MLQVPTYALYGEAGAAADSEFLHCESIQARSRLHDFRISPHRHEQFFQMLFLDGGSGELTVDGSQDRLTPPCLVLLPPLAVHGYSFSNDVEGLVLTLYERRLPDILRGSPAALTLLAGPLIIRLHDDAAAAMAVGGSLAAVAGEFTGRAPGRIAMMEAYLAIALLAACRAHLTQPSAATAGPAGGLALVLRFRQMIDRDFRGHAPVEDYAARLGVTPVHLRRLCRRHLGVAPLAAINARLVLEARRLLVFTTLAVNEVAAATGFADHAYFTRFFQRETGLAPTEFRARQRMNRGPAESAPPPPPRGGDGRRATRRSAA